MKTLTGLMPFLCVAFVAYSWTENHLLSVNTPDQWRAFYATGKQVYFEPQIIPRLAIWGLGSIATLCVWLAWQLRYRSVHQLPLDHQSLTRLPQVALFGLTTSLICAAGYYVTAPKIAAEFFGPMARWYTVLAIVGTLAQYYGWILLLWDIPNRKEIPLRPLLIATFGLVVTVTAMTVCREAIRIASLGAARIEELIPQHAAAMKVDGFWVFLLFVVINLGLIAWCFRLVKLNYVATDKVSDSSR